MTSNDSIPICPICKINLENPDTNLFQCTKCKREYIMEYEIMTYDDSIGTAHDDTAAEIELAGISAISGPGLETKKDELDFSTDHSVLEEENSKSKSDIKIPDYMKNTETKKVIEYKEE